MAAVIVVDVKGDVDAQIPVCGEGFIGQFEENSSKQETEMPEAIRRKPKASSTTDHNMG